MLAHVQGSNSKYVYRVVLLHFRTIRCMQEALSFIKLKLFILNLCQEANVTVILILKITFKLMGNLTVGDVYEPRDNQFGLFLGCCPPQKTLT